jgi:hypothetical protein
MPAQHRYLMAQHQKLDLLGSTLSGELGQHLQYWRSSKEALMRGIVAATSMAART